MRTKDDPAFVVEEIVIRAVGLLALNKGGGFRRAVLVVEGDFLPIIR